VYAPAGQQSKGTVELAITARDDQGANITSFSARIVPTAGEWKLLVVGADIPATLKDRPVKSLYLIPIVDSFRDGVVYLDDVSLHRLQ
jgi:hypothetical protein